MSRTGSGNQTCDKGSWNVMMFRFNEMRCGSSRNFWHLCLSQTGTLGGFWSSAFVDARNIHSEYLQQLVGLLFAREDQMQGPNNLNLASFALTHIGYHLIA